MEGQTKMHLSSDEEEQYEAYSLPDGKWSADDDFLDPEILDDLGFSSVQLVIENGDQYSEDEKFLVEEPRELAFTDYPGLHNFNVLVDSKTLNSSFGFSKDLNMIYVMPEREFPLDFHVIDYPENQQFFIRVTPAFYQENLQQQVLVCPNHAIGIHEPEMMNILRCTRKDTLYFGNTEEKKLNILFPMNHSTPSLQLIRQFFKFLCLSSCHHKNKNKISLIFTLENITGEVLGRKIILVKVAKNIMRDMSADNLKLSEYNNIRPTIPMTHGKRRRLRSNSDNIYSHIFSLLPAEDLEKINVFMRMLVMSKISECGGFRSPDSSTYVEILNLIPNN